MGPMNWIHGWGLAYGIYPWGSALVMDGQQGRSLDDARFQTDPSCFILYITQWEFRYSMSLGGEPSKQVRGG
jgi:hypothetical protein